MPRARASASVRCGGRGRRASSTGADGRCSSAASTASAALSAQHLVPSRAGVIETPAPVTVKPAFVAGRPTDGSSLASPATARDVSTASSRAVSPALVVSHSRSVAVGTVTVVPPARTRNGLAVSVTARSARARASSAVKRGGTRPRSTSTVTDVPLAAAWGRASATASASMPFPGRPGTTSNPRRLALMDGSTAATRPRSSAATVRRSAARSRWMCTAAGRWRTNDVAQDQTRPGNGPSRPTARAPALVRPASRATPASAMVVVNEWSPPVTRSFVSGQRRASPSTSDGTCSTRMPPIDRPASVTLRPTRSSWPRPSIAHPTVAATTAAATMPSATNPARRTRCTSRGSRSLRG